MGVFPDGVTQFSVGVCVFATSDVGLNFSINLCNLIFTSPLTSPHGHKQINLRRQISICL